MNILITPPEMHFDKGLGISAWHFMDASKELDKSENRRDLLSPICYLQRHAIELFLKSSIYILHKKFNLPFGDSFSLDKPAILVNNKWRQMSNTHNLTDLYTYLFLIFTNVTNELPKTTTWELPANLKSKIHLISGYDPKSTYFRYPETNNSNQDKKKSKIQPMNLDEAIKNAQNNKNSPVKCAVLLGKVDEVIETYDLVAEPLEEVKSSLTEVLEELHDLHCALLGELTHFS